MTRIFTSSMGLVTFAAGMAAVAAGPAYAQSSARTAANYAVAAGSGQAVGAVERVPARRNDRAGRICIDQDQTGTRIPRRVCRTQQEWEALGATVEPR